MKKIITIISLAVIAVSGCSKSNSGPKATAAFSTDSANYYLTESISFKNTSANSSSYSWDFGDGVKSTDQSPKHTFSVAGNYTVKLTANGSSTTTASLTIYNGIASYQVANKTSYSFPLVSFSVDDTGTLIDFVDDGTITSGGTGTIIYTVDSPVYIGGTLPNDSLFVAVYPHKLVKYQNNVIVLADTSSIVVGSSLNRKQTIDMLRNPKMLNERRKTIQQLRLFKQIAQ